MSRTASFLVDIPRWAGQQDDVRAVGLVGSHAHGTATANSDVDLVIVVDDVRRRLDDHSWLAVFGEVTKVEHEDWGLVQSLRVHYRGGLEVEFGLAAVEWATPPLDEGTAAVIRLGRSAIFDPHGLLTRAMKAAAGEHDPPHHMIG